MATFLFDSIIFGPVWSRRLGESLGINLLPANKKVCNFNCVYCECGPTTTHNPGPGFPDAGEVKKLLDLRLKEMHEKDEYLDSITFAGNGEPTLHPEFAQIMDDALELRNRFYPKANITVLSNATLIGDKKIFHALLKADMNILKLDSAIEDTLSHINCPKGDYRLPDILHTMKQFKGRLIIQTLFFRGSFNGITVDNSSEHEVMAWLIALQQIRPECVMIYSIARDTAVPGLVNIGLPKLKHIAGQVEAIGIKTHVTA